MKQPNSFPSRLRHALSAALGTRRFSTLVGEVVRVLDVAEPDAARILVGTVKPTPDQLAALQRKAGLSEAYLRSGEGTPLIDRSSNPPSGTSQATAPTPAMASVRPSIADSGPYLVSTAIGGATSHERAIVAAVLEACWWERQAHKHPEFRLRRLLMLVRRLERWRADVGSPTLIGLRRALRMWLNQLCYAAADQLGEKGSRALLEEFGFIPKSGGQKRAAVISIQAPQLAIGQRH